MIFIQISDRADFIKVHLAIALSANSDTGSINLPQAVGVSQDDYEDILVKRKKNNQIKFSLSFCHFILN